MKPDDPVRLQYERQLANLEPWTARQQLYGCGVVTAVVACAFIPAGITWLWCWLRG